ncbi:hypothetical protein KY348_04290 [Candidatus Woesearchaeota archaeon]|nr:hypothetical protein [Candidatus Woesearchaeota archaeon]
MVLILGFIVHLLGGSFWPVVLFGLASIVVVVVVQIVIFAVLIGLIKCFDYLIPRKQRLSMFIRLDSEAVGRKRQRRAVRNARTKFDERFASIACTGLPLEARLNALPWRKRTFRLMYQESKAWVCKPFAK